jgi:hypothetical protein
MPTDARPAARFSFQQPRWGAGEFYSPRGGKVTSINGGGLNSTGECIGEQRLDVLAAQAAALNRGFTLGAGQMFVTSYYWRGTGLKPWASVFGLRAKK